MKAATEHRVATISPYRQFVTEGSLMSYGPDTADIFRRSSSYVDRILKGELPAESARAVAGQIRICRQPQDGQVARPVGQRVVPAACRRGHRMRRREFITLLGGAAAAWPIAAHAQQQGDSVPKIGVLWPGAAPPASPRMELFRQALHQLGYVEGRTVVIELRYAKEGVRQLPDSLRNWSASRSMSSPRSVISPPK